MLVLSRQKGEAIIFHLPGGEVIRVTLCEIRDGHKIRLGIDAPDGVQVLREELVRWRPADEGDEPYCWFTRG